MSNYNRVLIPIDMTPGIGPLTPAVRRLIDTNESEITLLHVLEHSSVESNVAKEKEQASKHLEDAVPAEARNWATVVLSVRAGKPYHEIVEHAAAMQTDLIVMGVRGRHAVDIALFGSTAHRVIQLGPCPVLVVRT